MSRRNPDRRPDSSREELVWLAEPVQVSQRCRIPVVAYDETMRLPEWLAAVVAEQADDDAL